MAFSITNQLLYQLSYAGIYEGKPSILIHFFRPLYPPFVSLRQKQAQRADSVPLPLRTVRIPSEEASPFIKLTRLRTLIDAGRGGGFGVPALETTRPISRSFVSPVSLSRKPSCDRSIARARALHSPISHRPCESIDQVFTPH